MHRLELSWEPALFGARREPLRLLAISDERAPTLDEEANRARLEPIDAILGCGDLEPDYLAFLADAFRVPLFYVRGNHDRDAGWNAGRLHLPEPLEDRFEHIDGITLAGLSWPGRARGRAERDATAAWWQATTTALRATLGRQRPAIVISHVPPRDLGDQPEDAYHRGFGGYRWLWRVLRPRLWLHGHTTPASAATWRTAKAGTTLVNVTGGVLIEVARGVANPA
jgi:Icc-related predicted phosphoesterase